MIDQSLQYYNGDLLGFVPQTKRQERYGYSRRRHRTHNTITPKSKSRQKLSSTFGYF
ncbi:MAG: hypothetical protein V7K97_20320 [Nostoc sp.]|uniref:hypothetical protein n=1 Tax=Nostoc sp. TaxID=1180 RepID=UPI002FF8EB68